MIKKKSILGLLAIGLCLMVGCADATNSNNNESTIPADSNQDLTEEIVEEPFDFSSYTENVIQLPIYEKVWEEQLGTKYTYENFKYDADNRLVEWTQKGSGSGDHYRNYDENGNIVEEGFIDAVDEVKTVTYYEYDDEFNMIKSEEHQFDNKYNTTTTYEYENGKLVRDKSNSDYYGNSESVYEYDVNGYLNNKTTKSSENTESVLTYKNDDDGKILSREEISYDNGSLNGDYTVTYEYDEADNLINEHVVDNIEGDVWDHRYKYDVVNTIEINIDQDDRIMEKKDWKGFDECKTIPTPNSVLASLGDSSVEEKDGVILYTYVYKDDSEYNSDYHKYQRILADICGYEVKLDGAAVTVLENGELLSAIIAGTDETMGYFITVSFPMKSIETQQSADDKGSESNSAEKKESFTNKYGTTTTICAHSGCSNYIASSGDTNCCTTHSNKCLECKKYIDEDAMYCMDCLTSESNSSSSSGTKCQFKSSDGSVCNNIATKGELCDYHFEYLNDIYNGFTN